MADEIELFKRLLDAQVGSCSCPTKTPEVQHHAATCHYRLFYEARGEIAALIAALEDCEARVLHLRRMRDARGRAQTPR